MRTRLQKLAGDRVDPEHCPGGVTLDLAYGKRLGRQRSRPLTGRAGKVLIPINDVPAQC
jgi:hypothetical protein